MIYKASHKGIETGFVLYRYGRHFIAQGVDIDYVSCGDNREDAALTFIYGFNATVDENLTEFGHCHGFTKAPPKSVIDEAVRLASAL